MPNINNLTMPLNLPEEQPLRYPEEDLLISLCYQLTDTIIQADDAKNEFKEQLNTQTQDLIQKLNNKDKQKTEFIQSLDKLIYSYYENQPNNSNLDDDFIDKINFLDEQIRKAFIKVGAAQDQAAKDAAQQQEDKQSKIVTFFRKIDNWVDRGISTGKTGTALLKIITFFAILTSEAIHPIKYIISGLGDIWGLTKAYLDKTRVARKTGMATSFVRIMRSVAAVTLFALSISNPFTFVTFLLVGTLAGIYRDTYITYQNRKDIAAQEANLSDEHKTLEKFKQLNHSSEIIAAQGELILKQTVDLDKQKSYRSKNRLRLSLNILTLIGAALCIAGFFCPPLLPILGGIGVCFMAIATLLKTTDKMCTNGIVGLLKDETPAPTTPPSIRRESKSGSYLLILQKPEPPSSPGTPTSSVTSPSTTPTSQSQGFTSPEEPDSSRRAATDFPSPVECKEVEPKNIKEAESKNIHDTPPTENPPQQSSVVPSPSAPTCSSPPSTPLPRPEKTHDTFPTGNPHQLSIDVQLPSVTPPTSRVPSISPLPNHQHRFFPSQNSSIKKSGRASSITPQPTPKPSVLIRNRSVSQK